MNVRHWLKESSAALKSADISTARLDCLVLLEDASGQDRAWLLAHPEHELQGSVLKKLNTQIDQRTEHVPLAYLRGKAEFYGREFAVNAHTLVPRPETETMVDMLKLVRNMEADVAVWQVERRGRKLSKKHYPFEKQEPVSSLVKTDEGYKVAWQKPPRRRLSDKPAPVHGQSLRYHDEQLCLIDVGTGSGAIAVTAKLEFPEATVIATDIDAKCLETARANAEKLGADSEFLQGNLLEPLLPVVDSMGKGQHLPSTVYCLLANLPYVPDNFQINTAATHEPRHALFGGADGLDLYRELFGQLQAAAWKPTYILTESLPPQHETLAGVAEAAGYKLAKTDDFIQLFEL